MKNVIWVICFWSSSLEHCLWFCLLVNCDLATFMDTYIRLCLLLLYSFKQRWIWCSREFYHRSCGFEWLFWRWWKNLWLWRFEGQMRFNNNWKKIVQKLLHLNVSFGVRIFTLFGFLLQITIWISSISFYAYADITFQSSSDVSFEFVRTPN